MLICSVETATHAITVQIMFVLVEMVVPLVLWFVRNAQSIATTVIAISVATAKPVRIVVKLMVGATTAMSVATAFQIFVSVAKVVRTA